METRNPCSILLFVQPILRKGFYAPLQQDDALPTPDWTRPDLLAEAFEELWAKELARAGFVPVNSEDAVLAAEEGKVGVTKQPQRRRQPSALRVLFHLFAGRTAFAMSMQIVSVCCRFSTSLVIRRLAVLILLGGRQPGRWPGEGFALAAALAVLSCLEGLLATNANIRIQTIALAIFNTFATMVLRKGIRLHPAARGKFQRGSLVNLGLSDCNRLVESSNTLASGIAIPLMIIGALALGGGLAGPAFLITGLAVAMIIVIMLQLGKWQGAAFRRKAIAQGQRLSLLNEMLQSIKLTKYYALEEHFGAQILEKRRGEEEALLGMKLSLALNWAASILLPMSSMILVLLTHRGAYGYFPSVPDTFAILAVIKTLSFPFAFFGNVLGTVTMLMASCGRLQDLMLQPEVLRRDLKDVPEAQLEEELAVSIQGASFSWQTAEETDVSLILPQLHFKVPRGQLVVVVGELGSGKSSVLNAILGEMQELPNDSSKPTRISARQMAYCAQEAMILNATMRDNVLFGLDWDEEKYWKAVEASALAQDLLLLPAADMTEIGEKGLTLSGGQKARVALARAVYSALAVPDPAQALVLLDDPLSAVDAHVGSHLWEQCISGVLSKTTRILVTNQLQFLSDPAVSQIFVMERGEVAEMGPYSELVGIDGRFSRMLATLEGGGESPGGGLRRRANAKKTWSLDDGPSPLSQVVLQARSKSNVFNAGPASPISPSSARTDRVTEDEKKVEGAVTLDTLLFYLRGLGPWPVVLLLLFFGWSYHAGELLPDLYLALWMAGEPLGLSPQGAEDAASRLGVWVIVGLVGLAIATNARFNWAFGAVRAGRASHELVLRRVLSCPMSFFDSTPSGRILNRMGEDQMNLDWTVSLQVEVCLLVLSQAFNTTVLVIGVCPWLALGLVVVLPLLKFLREIHRRSVREGVRFWMLTKSPVFNIMEEMLVGVPTVAAYGRLDRFLERYDAALRANNNWLFTKDMMNQWAEQRLQLVGAAVTGTLAALLIGIPGLAPASIGSIAIIYALQLAQFLRWSAFFLVQVESSLASVERISEYSALPQEAPRQQPADAGALKLGWPGEAPEVEFQNLQVRYRPHLPLVLRDFSAKLRPMEKVGVVGRTGSGKSTLLSCLFRLVEPEAGRILIGGQDIGLLGLGLLRRRVTTVPQDPLLFSGTLRHNLDPADERTDDAILDGLKRCGMAEFVDRLDGGLAAKVAEQGSNFSVGERQVLCLARALLRDTRVLCLDEATANVDPENDARIQRTIRVEFASCTVLTIAHRLHTVVDADRIMVLEAGQLKQFDAPQRLLQIEGPFQAMAIEAGVTAQGMDTAPRPVAGSTAL